MSPPLTQHELMRTLVNVLEPMRTHTPEDENIRYASGPLSVVLDALLQDDLPVLMALALAAVLIVETAKHPKGGPSWQSAKLEFIKALTQVAEVHAEPDDHPTLQ